MNSRLSLHCPAAAECTVCLRRSGLEVREVETEDGPACTTACQRCWERNEVPPISPMVVALCVEVHRAHLGLAGVAR